MPDLPVDQGLAELSDTLLAVAVFVYSLALLAYAAEYAFGRRGRVGTTLAGPAGQDGQAGHAEVPAARQPEPALVGAGARADAEALGAGQAAARGGEVDGVPVSAHPGWPDAPVPTGTGGGGGAATAAGGGGGVPSHRAEMLGRAGVALTVLAWAVHLASVVLRGLSVGRVPFGDMYEFSTAAALVATSVFLLLLLRRPVRYLGAFVVLPVLLTLGLAGTVLYANAGPLEPALNSYWMQIHVTAMILAAGIFTVATVVTVLFLIAHRYELRLAAGRSVGVSGLARLLPGSGTLDRRAYRLVAFGFPVWTFAVIAGAIWAEAAWGRYWGWDPKETWALITWIAYACYLHARATAGWKGVRSAMIALVAFAVFLFSYFGVNIWVVGLHSYAGIG